MKNYSLIIFLIFFSCSSQEYNGNFNISNYSNYELISFDEIENIADFERDFRAKAKNNKELSFVVPFDFDQQKFDDNAKTGFQLKAINTNCLLQIDCHSGNQLKFYLDEFSELLDKKHHSVTNIFIEDLLLDSYNNNGQNPLLADTPDDVIIEIYIERNVKLNTIGPSLFRISNLYNKVLKKLKPTESLPVRELFEKYPLKIFLREKV